MYVDERGIIQDSQEAAKWYWPTAEQGYVDAQFRLGVMYDQGESVPQNYQEAVKYCRLASVQGHANALTGLGIMCGQGQGIAQDDVLAHMWLA